jgi:hypothetical protein
MDEQAATHNGDVAHRYVVGLHKSDLGALSDSVKPLLSELRQAIANHAKYEGYNIAGEAEVALEEDVAQRIGSCVVKTGKTLSTPREPITQPHQLDVKPAVVVLDESTSALDPENEELMCVFHHVFLCDTVMFAVGTKRCFAWASVLCLWAIGRS